MLGGLIVTNNMTNMPVNFYSMVGIIFIPSTDYTLHRGPKSGLTIKRDNCPFQEWSSYFILTAGSFPLNSEPWLIKDKKEKKDILVSSSSLFCYTADHGPHP